MVDVNVEADGSTTFENATEGAGQEEAFTGGEEGAGGEGFAGAEGGEEAFEEVAKSIDPAIYLLIAVGKKFMKWWIKQSDCHREACHDLEQFNEVRTLHWQ